MKTKTIFYPLALLAFLVIGSSFSNSENINNEVEPKIENESFAKYLSHFEKVSLPFGIKIEPEVNPHDFASQHLSTINRKREKIAEAWNYTSTEMRFRLSRMGPPVIIPIARFYLDGDKIATVIRKQLEMHIPNNYEYKMVVYDLKGNILSKNEKLNNRNPAGLTLASTNTRSTQSFTISESGIISIKSFKKIWEKDLKENGVRNNSVKEYLFTGLEAHQIKNDGSILEVNSNLMNTRASIDQISRKNKSDKSNL